MPAAPWGIDVSQMDPRTASMLSGIDFNSAANAGVNLPPLFQSLMASGAKPEQIQSFAKMISNGSDYAGQFGKYAHPDTIQNNLKQYLGGQTDATKFGANQGHGGWLQHHGGDVANWAFNPVDAATGNRISQGTARIASQIYDKTGGQVGGWLGDHVLGQHGMLASPTRALNAWSMGVLAPGAQLNPIGAGQRTDYYVNRQHGLNPRQAVGAVGSDTATLASTALTAGAGAGLGALTRGLVGAGIGGVGGASRAYGSGQNMLTGFGRGAVPGVIGSLAPGGGTLGNIGRGAAGGAAGAALNGGNRDAIWQGALLGGASPAISGGSGALGVNPYIGQLASNVGTGYLRNLLQPKPQMSGNPNAGMPSNMYRPPTFPSKVGMTPPMGWNPGSGYRPPTGPQQMPPWMQRPPPPNAGYQMQAPQQPAYGPNQSGSSHADIMASIMGRPAQSAPMMMAPPPPNAGLQMRAPAFANVPGQAPVNNKTPLPMGRQQYPTNY